MQTIDQRCAENAYKAYCELNRQQEKDKIFGFAKKMPMMIMSSGLGNAVMFKLKDDKELVKYLLKWLFPGENFNVQIDDKEKKEKEEIKKIEQIVFQKLLTSRDSLRINTVKALKWLEWFNRFADASETSDKE